MKVSTKARVRYLWEEAERKAKEDALLASTLPAERPDRCYVRIAGSEIVDFGERLPDGRIKTGCFGIINHRDFCSWEWSTNLVAWKRIG